MNRLRSARLTDYLSASQILVEPDEIPLFQILIALAGSVVKSGAVRSPLEYYQDLANHVSAWPAPPEGDAGPVTRVFRLSSTGVKWISAALAVCPDGIRSKDGGPFQILMLISAPVGDDSASETLAEAGWRLLSSGSNRKMLLAATGSATVWSTLCQLESDAARIAAEEE